MSKTPVDPLFAQFIATNIAYWQERVTGINDESISTLDDDKGNLFQAVQFGLAYPTTTAEAVELVITLFPLIERRGYWSEWVPIVLQAIDQAETSQKRAQLLNQLGTLYRVLHLLDKALEAHGRVITVSDAEIPSDTVVKAHIHMASIYYLQHAYDSAHHHGEIALALMPASSPNSDRASLYNTLGLIAVDRGMYQEALTLYQSAVELYRMTDEMTYLAMTIDNMGIAYDRSGNLHQAMQCFDESIAILNQTSSEMQKSMVLLNKGITFYKLGDLVHAEEMLRKAYSPYLQQSSSLRHKAFVTSNLGCIILEQNRPQEAAYFFSIAVTLWEEMDDTLMLGNTLGDLGRAHIAMLNIEEARWHLDRALELVAQFPDNAWAQNELVKLQQKQKQLDGS
jgi:tetratricopeptide (TPR) repeat protein